MLTGHSGTTLNDAIREWLAMTDPARAAEENQLFPTPRASDARRKDAPFHHDPSIDPAGTPGSPTVYLNPSFVEALMGFPIGWTDLPRSETLSLKL